MKPQTTEEGKWIPSNGITPLVRERERLAQQQRQSLIELFTPEEIAEAVK